MSDTPYNQFPELRKEKKLAAEALAGLKFESVLEVGSQWGEVLMGIKEKFPDAKLVGIDIDKPTMDAARSITNLDLRLGDVLNNNIKNKEFDVVVADALFCMLRPEDVVDAFKEMIRIARKYLVLVELKSDEPTGVVKGGRTGADWPALLKKEGLEFTEKKITPEMWEANPWMEFGYVYLVKMLPSKLGEVSTEKKPFCDSCDSKGVRHKKECPKSKPKS